MEKKGSSLGTSHVVFSVRSATFLLGSALPSQEQKQATFGAQTVRNTVATAMEGGFAHHLVKTCGNHVFTPSET